MVRCVQAHGTTAQGLLITQRGGTTAGEGDLDSAVVAPAKGLEEKFTLRDEAFNVYRRVGGRQQFGGVLDLRFGDDGLVVWAHLREGRDRERVSNANGERTLTIKPLLSSPCCKSLVCVKRVRVWAEIRRICVVLGSRLGRVSQVSLTVVANASHGMILEVGAYAWQIDNLLDASFIQEVLRPETTTLKHLWCVQPAGAKDNLLLCLDRDGRCAIWRTSFLNPDRLSVLLSIEENLVGPISGDDLQILPASNRVVVTAPCV